MTTAEILARTIGYIEETMWTQDRDGCWTWCIYCDEEQPHHSPDCEAAALIKDCKAHIETLEGLDT